MSRNRRGDKSPLKSESSSPGPSARRPRDTRIGGSGGFTIIELIIVGIVIGILAGVAIPTYRSFLKRARQVEAPAALSEIKRLQAMYFAFNGSYGTLVEIGYRPSAALRYYNVTVDLLEPPEGKSPGFKATARGNIDGDPEEDEWMITELGSPQHLHVD